MLRYWFNTVNRLPPVPRDSRVILSDLCNKVELLKQKIVQEMTHTCATLDNYIIHGTALFFLTQPQRFCLNLAHFKRTCL